jgi:hypothetical protein
MGGYSHKKMNVSDCLVAFPESVVVVVLDSVDTLVMIFLSYLLLGVVQKNFDREAVLQKNDSDVRITPSPF